MQQGDCILADCNITGSNISSVDKPKFALRPLWEFNIFPSLEALVAPECACEGGVVVHQEDNAGISNCNQNCKIVQTPTLTLNHTPTLTNFHVGPHKEGGYHEWLAKEFEERGWKIELQAPQGPYRLVNSYSFVNLCHRMDRMQ